MTRPHRTLLLPLAAVLGLSLVWSSGTAGAGDTGRPGFADTIDSILTDPLLSGAAAQVVVRDPATGQTLYDRDGDRRLMPASTTKLLTASAALDILGPDHRFRTEVLRTRDGDLYLRGTGDPVLLPGELDDLAAEVAAAGITHVPGDLVADDTLFTGPGLGRAWGWDAEQYAYSAPVSALTLAPDTDYDSGSVRVSAGPGAAPGKPASVTLHPAPDLLTVDNRAVTVAAGGPHTLSVGRTHGQDTITVTGTVPAGAAPTDTWLSVTDPTAYTAAVFADALAAHGVTVAGTTVTGRAVPAGAETVAAHTSMPLSEILVPFLKLSVNPHGEALLKAIGAADTGTGSWTAGLAAVADHATRLGLDPGGYAQVDGSGLSRMNMIAPADFADLLAAVRDEPWFGHWYAALPIACEPDRLVGGTLRSRMCGTPAAGNARAKTGTLTGATALSGYVTTAGGRELVFSIMINHHLGSGQTRVQDAIVAALAADGGPGPRTTTPPPIAPLTERQEEVAEAGLECSWVKPAVC
ncbi:D-alanyl-D-alanine carboxypeptidase/D-alanyl-D-alanine endopeptidase [Streptomyces carpaticus]|uniref:D-alanyl-D-alanine carboxypeptidase/D-alanyl-D-alanine endopeptidase n=1 Tax=Streptomyces carpaticus TaxID=285558 RepID=UPI0031F7C606